MHERFSITFRFQLLDMAFVDKEVFHVQSARVQRTDQTAWQMHRDDNSVCIAFLVMRTSA